MYIPWSRLEEVVRRHLLDRRNRSHIWLLHYLFLDQINDDCDTFVMTWNNHPIGGKGKDMTPNVS